MDKSRSVQFRLTGTSEMHSIFMLDLFYELEAAKSKLGIVKMGLIVTTLEDILQGWVGSSDILFHLTFVQMLKQLSLRGGRVIITEVQVQAIQAHEIGTHIFIILGTNVHLLLEACVITSVIVPPVVFCIAVAVFSIASIRARIGIVSEAPCSEESIRY